MQSMSKSTMPQYPDPSIRGNIGPIEQPGRIAEARAIVARHAGRIATSALMVLGLSAGSAYMSIEANDHYEAARQLPTITNDHAPVEHEQVAFVRDGTIAGLAGIGAVLSAGGYVRRRNGQYGKPAPKRP